MPGTTAIAVMRATLLVALLAYFSGALGISLMHEQRAQGLMLAPGSNTDPGVRVLLVDRPASLAPGADPPPTHDKLVVDVLTPSLVVTPDEPDNPERSFPVGAGEQIIFHPDPDGIMISTPSREERWLVTRVRVQPRKTTREPSAEENGEPDNPAKLNPTTFEAAGGGPVFSLGDRRYRGSLEVHYKSAKELVAINALPMEAYVEGVVAVEMSPSWPLHALMAQAIASRSFAYATRLRVRGKLAYDVKDAVEFQDYRGHGFGNELIEDAVKRTAGMVLCVQGQPFAPLFCASSGGWTESIDAVQPGATALYGASLSGVMPSQEDPWCRPAAEALGKLSTHWQTKTVLKPGLIRDRLNAWLRARGDNRTIGHISDVRVGERDPVSHRVVTVIIHHLQADGGTPIPAHVFRMIVGPMDIRSTLWSDDSPRKIENLQDRSKNYEITCLGYGHGVGMSQISAWGMADAGRHYDEILGFFYPGAELRKW